MSGLIKIISNGEERTLFYKEKGETKAITFRKEAYLQAFLEAKAQDAAIQAVEVKNKVTQAPPKREEKWDKRK